MTFIIILTQLWFSGELYSPIPKMLDGKPYWMCVKELSEDRAIVYWIGKS